MSTITTEAPITDLADVDAQFETFAADLSRARERAERYETKYVRACAEIDKLKRRAGELKSREGHRVHAAAPRELHEAPLFLDALEQLRHEVYTAWVTRIPAADKSRRPLGRYSIGPEFIASLALEGLDRSKIVDVVVEVVTGLADQIPGRQMHLLRDPSGAAVTRGGATCWRVSLQAETPGARRMHFWRTSSSVELSRIGHHDDFRP